MVAVQEPAIPRSQHDVGRDEKSADVEAPRLSGSDDESGISQAIGVTRIETTRMSPAWAPTDIQTPCSLAAGSSTASGDTPFATSAYKKHTLVATIGVISAVVAAVTQPIMGKISDLASRPAALCAAVTLFTVGYIIVASSRRVSDVVVGLALNQFGQLGIRQMEILLVADITVLEWRGLGQALTSVPWVLSAFIAGYISQGINAYSESGWRWGYGMFCAIVPVCIAPTIMFLFWAQRRARPETELALQRQGGPDPQTRWERLKTFVVQVDIVGLLLIGTSFACLLAPGTLRGTAKGGFSNPSLIALYVVGGVLFLAFGVWEYFFVKHGLMPRRLMNRTFYYFTRRLGETYDLSWVYIIKPEWSARNYTFFGNIMITGLCVFALVAGVFMRVTHGYKWVQIAGLAIRSIGQGIQYLSTGNQTTGTLVMGRILMSVGGGTLFITTQVAAQASVPHADMAMAVAIIGLWTQLGGGIGAAISGAVWNQQVPANLEKYIGATHNATQRAEIFGSLLKARAAEPHALVNQAYTEAIKPLYLAALIVSLLAFIPALLTREIYLGKEHNDVEGKKVREKAAAARPEA
ncbi:hypothetical protein Q8F55_007333 [Vanrija albida]|uniref:Major facilitator superfamily (MFS) profile domain-containing protein n=1 Tax=Vanrija albida TaxID=181172 RepID=A0ABR3Q009_9TREE